MTYIKEKCKILAQLGVHVTDSQRDYMYSLLCNSLEKSEIRIDNYARHLINARYGD